MAESAEIGFDIRPKLAYDAGFTWACAKLGGHPIAQDMTPASWDDGEFAAEFRNGWADGSEAWHRNPSYFDG